MQRVISRRQLLKWSAAASATLLAACQPKVVEKVVEKVVTQEVEKVVKETVVVEGTPKVVEKVVKETVVVEKQAAKAKPGQKVVVRFSSRGNSLEDTSTDAALVRGFNAAHPDIEVKFQAYPEGYDDKMLTLLAGGDPPEVFWYPAQGTGNLAIRGVLMNLMEMINLDPAYDWADFYDFTKQPPVIEGDKVWGIPQGLSPHVVFYNRDLFKGKGLKTPNELYDAGQWTWQTFLEASQAFTTPEGTAAADRTYGYMGPSWGMFWWGNYWIWVLTAGGQIYSPGGNEWLLDTPEAVEGLKFFQDLIHKYKVMPKPQDTGSLPIGDMFAQGKIAMRGDGRWAVEEFRETCKFDWDVVPIPVNKADAALNYTGFWCIPKVCKYPEQAWTFLSYWTSKEIMVQGSLAGGNAPARKSGVEDPAFLNDKPPEHTIYFAKGSKQFAYIEPCFPWFPEVEYQIVEPAFDKAWQEGEPIEGIVKEISPKVAAKIAEAKDRLAKGIFDTPKQ